MIEYALLVAGGGLRTFATSAVDWAAGVDWTLVGPAALVLVALRVVVWALHRRHPF